MSCFSSPSMPPGEPSSWNPKTVQKWMKFKGLDKDTCKPMSALTGKALLALTFDDVERKFKLMPSKFLIALNGLRRDCNLPILEKVAPAPPPPLEPEVSEPAPVHEEPLPVDEITQLEITDRVTMDSLTNDRMTQESVADPKVVPSEAATGTAFIPFKEAQTVHDWAPALRTYIPEAPALDTLVHYLESLGKGVGGGLMEAAAAQPGFGTLFAACWGLVSTAARAGVARDNCVKASNLAGDTLRMLDVAWRRTHSAAVQDQSHTVELVSDATLTQLADSMNVLSACVMPFTQPGWLVELCCNERMKGRFDAAHNAVVDSLKKEGLELLPGGKPMLRGDYRDVPKAVRRLVKQHGSGSITSGLVALKAAGVQSEGVKELAALLELGGHDETYGCLLVMAELEALPTGLDIEVYYNSLVIGDNQGEAHHAVFDWYDREHKTGYIDLPRFQVLLSDLGMLEGKNDAEAQAYLLASFKTADTKNEGVLSREAFCAFYSTLTTSRSRQQLRARMGLAAEEELRGVFVAFASFGSGVDVHNIDNAHFYKLTKECGLTGANLTSNDVDIIFAKAKAKKARRVNFEQFLDALSLCADKKGLTLEAVVRKVLLASGPIAHGTRPDLVRLHDDKSTYTGVHAKGGPKAVDPSRNDLSTIVDRSEADVRGVKKTPPLASKVPGASRTASLASRKQPQFMSSLPPPAEFMRTSLGPGALAMAGLGVSPIQGANRRQSLSNTNGGTADLKEMFAAFASFGNTGAAAGGASPGNAAWQRFEMDSSRFLKLCRECRLFDTKSDGFTSTRADLIFAKVKQQGQNKISYAEFERALQLVAEAKGVSAADVTSTVCSSDGPLLTRMVNVS